MRRYRISRAVKAAMDAEQDRRRAMSETRSAAIWQPYPETDDKPWSPQLRALESTADIIGYGGQAGGGKTDLSIGMAATKHRVSIIFRKIRKNLRGIIKRTRQLFAGKARFNGTDLIWRGLPGNREITLAGIQHEKDVENFRGDPYDLMVFDEATQFRESEIWFLSGWNRSTDPDMHCQILLTFNPPRNVDERWIVRFFAPWLDKKHPNRAMPGELRWYARVDGEEVERPDGSAFEHELQDGTIEVIKPTSRTFFPAKLSDNPALARTNYRATLQMLPEPLRSQVLYGDFDAGIEDDAYQIIPTAWLLASMERWTRAGGKNYDLRGFWPERIAQDVAQGGPDKTVVARKYGHWVPWLDKYEGKDTPDGRSAALTIVKYQGGVAKVFVDCSGGYGNSCFERLIEPIEKGGYGLRKFAHPINFGGSSDYYDPSGQFRMKNLRSEMLWRLRAALDPDQPGGSTLCLPDDPELLQDLAAARYEPRGDYFYTEPKEEIAKRIGRSPDCGDAVMLLMLPEPNTQGGRDQIGFARNPTADNRGSFRRRIG